MKTKAYVHICIFLPLKITYQYNHTISTGDEFALKNWLHTENFFFFWVERTHQYEETIYLELYFIFFWLCAPSYVGKW